MGSGENDEYVSEESDYYGDEEMSRDLELQEMDFDIPGYWAYHSRLPAVVAHMSGARTSASGPPVRNIYEGELHHARQLSETPADFVQRLPPSKTLRTDAGEWLYVANPHVPQSVLDADHEGLTRDGEGALERFLTFKEAVEREVGGGAASDASRRLRSAQDQLAKDLQKSAVKHNIISGKWMLFSKIKELDSSWATVCQGVVDGRLGVAAKVATVGAERNKDELRLICIYTQDFSDRNDVLRVLRTIADLGLIRDQRGIWYKSEAYTHLGIEGRNKYGLRNSLYGSREMLGSR